MLRPDLFIVTANAEFEDHWFVEVDLGTEHLPTVVRKCGQYETYRRTGTEQHASGGVFPIVLWVVQTAIRKAKVAAAIRAAGSLDHGLYRVATLDELITTVTAGAGE